MRDTVFTRHSVRLAEVDGEIVGFASRDGTWLMNLYVKPGWTGHGIGTQLLRAMLANAANATPVLRVCTFARNEHARRFLEWQGFRPVGSGDGSANEEHEPELRYERSTRDVTPPARGQRTLQRLARELQLPARELELVAQPLAQRGKRRPIAHARRIDEMVRMRGFVRDR